MAALLVGAGPQPGGDAVLEQAVRARLLQVGDRDVQAADKYEERQREPQQQWPGQGEEDPSRIVKSLLVERRRLALEALPGIAHKNLGADPAAWSAWWSEERAKAGPQVSPEGWTLTGI